MTLVLPALSRLISPNYSNRGGQRVRLIIVHDCEGSFAGSVSWFAMAASQVSANIVLKDDGSAATLMVDWRNKAWHACNFNSFSEGIEAAGYASKGLGVPEWQALANIVAYRLKANGIPCQYAIAENNWTGFCQHVDLGQAGGGHHDITLDSAVRVSFLAMVVEAYSQPMPNSWGSVGSTPLQVAPVGWKPSGTVRHDLTPPNLDWVQMRLNALGITPTSLTVDDLDGPETKAAIRAFQRRAKLADIDGDAGPLTIAALEKKEKEKV
jgi:N-acetyl-anhydromuramyl-L-alanine amidase AmpD